MQDRAQGSDSRYAAAILVMQEMNWSWADLQAAPFDLVEEVLIRIRVREHWNREKAKRRAEVARQRGEKMVSR